MPELPEVETVCRGIAPLISGATIARAVVRDRRLRRPIPADFAGKTVGRTICAVRRRAKYILLDLEGGSHLLIHLGMSGSLRVVPQSTPAQPHDHVDLLLDNGTLLRFRDPRRFGLCLVIDGDPDTHPLLAHLGPEPLSGGLTAAYLAELAAGRSLAIKNFLMDQRVVVGVGNIYASEALFLAGIAPQRPAGQVTVKEFAHLVQAVQAVLRQAIAAGGTTLKDFQNAAGDPGYFAIELKVYGRDGEPCPVCGRPLQSERIGGRSSYYCRRCQR